MESRDQERIDAYLMGKLDEKARQAFEEEINESPELAEAVAQHSRFVHGVEELHFRELLEELHQEGVGQEKNGIKRRKRWPIWSIAAVLLLLLGVFWIFQPNPTSEFSIQLDPGLPTTLGGTNALAFGEGMNAYKQDDYVSARAYWTPLWEAHPQNDTLLFYLAQVDLGEERFQASLEKLEQLIKNEESGFLEKARWYVALSHLKLGQIEAAKALLQDISTRQHPKSKEAQELLKTIP